MNTKDELSKFLTIISSIIPPVGFVLFFKYRKISPNKGGEALGAAIIGIPIGVIMGNYVLPYLGDLIF